MGMGTTGPEGSDVVVGGQCLGGETSLRAPSLMVDHNIPGFGLAADSQHVPTSCHVLTYPALTEAHNRRGHFRLS